MVKFSRRLWILLGLLVLGSWGGPPAGAEQPLKKIRFLLDWYPQAEQGGYFYALVHNYYKDAGLDVEIIPASPGMFSTNVVIAGGADISMAPGDQIMQASAQGLPLVSVMTTMQHDPKAIMVHDESPVKDFPDLDGHAIAVLPGQTWFLYLVKKYHLTKIRELRMNFGVANFLHDPNYIQESFVTSEPFFCSQHGVKVRSLLVKDTGCDPYRAAFTTDKLIQSDPAAVQAFVSASIKGWKQYLVDPASTDEEIKRRNPQMTQAQLDYSRGKLIEFHFIEGDPAKGDAVGKLDPARFAAQYKIMRDLNVITSDFDYTKSYTTQFCSPTAK
ncbi:MAG TPA: ABC transporter substrate-binding protein [Candidatus Methylacidiphilales bacterium]